jgi:hypothetical protein
MITQTYRIPLFCDITLAGRIEKAEAQFIAACNEAARRRRGDQDGFAIPLGGGIASYAEPDSPLNKVAGLGFADGPDRAELDTIERAFIDRSAPVQMEIAGLADPALLELLAERGYRLVSFENVLGRALGNTVEQVAPAASTSASAATTESPSSPGPQLHPPSAAAASRAPCCPPGSPTPPQPAATSPSSPSNPAPSRNRTPSVAASTCSTVAPS